MLDNESIVYGLIQDFAPGDEQDKVLRADHNLRVIAALPEQFGGPIISRDMFAVTPNEEFSGTYHSQVIHFGGSYKALEYEWEAWMKAFEDLLKQLYWVSATVHLKTEMAGNHAFHWNAAGSHTPNTDFNMRCEWESEKFVQTV